MSPTYDSYFLFFPTSGILFRPRQNTYHLFSGETLAQVRAGIEAGEEGHALACRLSEHGPLFRDLRRIHSRSVEATRTTEPTTSEFAPRFKAYCDRLPASDGRGEGLLTILVCFAVLTSKVLIALGRFDLVARGTRSRRVRHRLTAEDALLGRIGRAIARARRLMPGRFDCVGVAFAYKTVLGAYGYPCDVHIGIIDQPFTAHMWASTEGVILGDIEQVTEDFETVYSSSW